MLSLHDDAHLLFSLKILSSPTSSAPSPSLLLILHHVVLNLVLLVKLVILHMASNNQAYLTGKVQFHVEEFTKVVTDGYGLVTASY